MNRLSILLSISIALLLAVFTIAPILFFYFPDFNESGSQYLIEIHDNKVDKMVLLTPEEIEALPGLKEELIGNIIFSLTGGIAASIVLSFWITGPLRRLTRKIGENDFPIAEPLKPTGTHEVRLLTKEFNRLSASVKKKEELHRTLLADVSHELLTPLSVIQGNLRAILDGVYPFESGEIERIYHQSRHLSALVNELRQLSQAEAGAMKLNIIPLPVEDILQELYELFKPLADEDRIDFSMNSGTGFMLMADPMRIRQVLSNLISNAFRHTPVGGRVTLEGCVRDCMVEIRVIDSGSGFPPEKAEHLFERYYRDESSLRGDRTGSGLGLAIARALTVLHGGTLTALSPGQDSGAVFTLRIPEYRCSSVSVEPSS